MDKMAEMIIHAGANVNSKNDKEVTALIIAAVQGHTKVLRILAHHPSILLDSYVCLGTKINLAPKCRDTVSIVRGGYVTKRMLRSPNICLVMSSYGGSSSSESAAKHCMVTIQGFIQGGGRGGTSPPFENPPPPPL